MLVGAASAFKNLNLLRYRAPSILTAAPSSVDLAAEKNEAEKILRVLTSSRWSLKSKKEKYEPLRKLRQESNDRYLAILKEMIALIGTVPDESKRIPVLGRFIPTLSYKLGCLKRVLDANIDDDSANGQMRGLLIILAELTKTRGGIRSLEKESLKALKHKVTMKEMKKNTPAGLETPEYTVLEEKKGLTDDWEIREYKDFTTASLQMDPSTRDGKNKGPQGFNTLAGYIFGKNKEEKKMAMTTPVIINGKNDEMSFIMPSDYWPEEKLKEAPAPMDNSGVVIQKYSSMTDSNNVCAVLWFKGYAFGAKANQRKEQLLEMIANDDKYELCNEKDIPVLMQYNDPFVPPWKRRNEVAVAVKKVQK